MKNIALLLKNAPQELKLYSPIYGDVYFDSIDVVDDYGNYVIYVHFLSLQERCTRPTNEKDDDVIAFYANGTTSNNISTITPECVLFPSKEQRNWNDFSCDTQHDNDTTTIFSLAWCKDCKNLNDTDFCRENCQKWYLGRPIGYCSLNGQCGTCNELCKQSNNCKK